MHGGYPVGTGCAPFRSLIEERVSQSAGGKLKFGTREVRDISSM